MKQEELIASEDIAVVVKIRARTHVVVPNQDVRQQAAALARLEDCESLANLREGLISEFLSNAGRYVEILRVVDAAYQQQVLSQ